MSTKDFIKGLYNMKDLKVKITEDLHTRLTQLCHHHGDLAFHIRRALLAYVKVQEMSKRCVECVFYPNKPGSCDRGIVSSGPDDGCMLFGTYRR